MLTKEFIDTHGITMESKVVESNPSPFMSDNEMIHFQCVLVKGEKKSEDISYSMGLGNVETWAKTNTRCKGLYRHRQDPQAGDLAKAFQPRRSMYHDKLRQVIMEEAQKRMTPPLPGLLECLAMDSQSVENVRCFEDWADEFGMDTDSRKAFECYELTCKTTANLAHFMGESVFQEFLTIEEDY